MKMISMAKTADDVKEEMAATAPTPMATTSTYPYGLCISLDDETLEKLGLDGDQPTVGEVMQFTAMAKVTSASMNERENADGSKEQCCRIELQITDMAVPSADPAEEQIAKSEARRKRFYGGNDNDGDEA